MKVESKFFFASLKVPRPDGKEDSLGLAVLDEPSSRQTDPHLIWIQRGYESKQSITSGLITVREKENYNAYVSQFSVLFFN